MIEREQLTKLYIFKKYSTPAIAKILKVNVSTVRYWLLKHCIPIRSLTESRHTRHDYKGIIPVNELHMLYTNNKYSCGDIAKQYGFKSATSVNNQLKKNNIMLRTTDNVTEKTKTKFKKTMLLKYNVENPQQLKSVQEKTKHTKQKTGSYIPQLSDKVWLRNQHHVEQKTHAQIAEELHISFSAVNHAMQRYEIKTFCHNKSFRENQWLDSLCIPSLIRNPSLRLNCGKLVKPDGYDPITNTVYEFFGDFWHGNPTKFNSTDINPRNKKTYGELYEETLHKIQIYKNNGYNVVYTWESEQ